MGHPPAHREPIHLTMAELTDEQKDAISHRGRAALERCSAWLRSRLIAAEIATARPRPA